MKKMGAFMSLVKEQILTWLHLSYEQDPLRRTSFSLHFLGNSGMMNSNYLNEPQKLLGNTSKGLCLSFLKFVQPSWQGSGPPGGISLTGTSSLQMQSLQSTPACAWPGLLSTHKYFTSRLDWLRIITYYIVFPKTTFVDQSAWQNIRDKI